MDPVPPPQPTVIKFNIASKPNAPKRPQQPVVEDKKDFIAEITGNQIISKEPVQTRDGPFVIPLSAQGHTKKTKPNPKEEKPSEPKLTTNGANNNTINDVTNGASDDSTKTLDQLAAEAIIKDATMEPETETNERTVPLTVANQIDGIDEFTDEDERFKHDLQSRPNEANEEEYDSMPIEEFGFAMLRGMGWAPGGQIGLNTRGLAEPIEFVKRPGYRLGLGATPKDIPKKEKKYIKPGESREPEPIMVAQAGPDGKVRHIKNISEKLVPLKRGLQNGQLVAIVSGPHEGMYARITTIDGDDLVVRISTSSEEVMVSKSDVSLVDSKSLSEGHPALKLLMKDKKEKDQREEKESGSYNKKDSSSKSSSKDYTSSSTSSSSSSSSSNKSWIRPRIMVRIVSKSFQNGKYYNKKGRIYDVIGRNECTVQFDNGSLLEGVKQRMLETVIPPAGDKVMIVEGVNKGKIGRLLERTKGRDTEKAVVQMIGDFSVETFSLDDVAQYVGTFDEEAVDMNV